MNYVYKTFQIQTNINLGNNKESKKGVFAKCDTKYIETPRQSARSEKLFISSHPPFMFMIKKTGLVT
jgi:hypothetical protein